MDKVEKDKELKLCSIGYYHLDGIRLGRGNFARVEMATHTILGVQVAIKFVNTSDLKQEYIRKNFEREGRVLSCFNHQNIVRLYETLQTASFYCLVLEYVQGDNLLAVIKSQPKNRLEESSARLLMLQLVGAIKHVHENNIVHRDLKPENILINKESRLKLIDFGLSNFYDPSRPLQTHCGSPEYAAPELFYSQGTYGPEIDMWSLGVILFTMVVGLMPFSYPHNKHDSALEKRNKLLQKTCRGLVNVHHKAMIHLTKPCKDMLKQLLQPNREKRLKLKELCNHPWLIGSPNRIITFENPFEYNYRDKDLAVNQISKIMNIPKDKVEEQVSINKFDSINAMLYLILDIVRRNNVCFNIKEFNHNISLQKIITEKSKFGGKNEKYPDLFHTSVASPINKNVSHVSCKKCETLNLQNKSNFSKDFNLNQSINSNFPKNDKSEKSSEKPRISKDERVSSNISGDKTSRSKEEYPSSRNLIKRFLSETIIRDSATDVKDTYFDCTKYPSKSSIKEENSSKNINKTVVENTEEQIGQQMNKKQYLPQNKISKDFSGINHDEKYTNYDNKKQFVSVCYSKLPLNKIEKPPMEENPGKIHLVNKCKTNLCYSSNGSTNIFKKTECSRENVPEKILNQSNKCPSNRHSSLLQLLSEWSNPFPHIPPKRDISQKDTTENQSESNRKTKVNSKPLTILLNNDQQKEKCSGIKINKSLNSTLPIRNISRKGEILIESVQERNPNVLKKLISTGKPVMKIRGIVSSQKQIRAKNNNEQLLADKSNHSHQFKNELPETYLSSDQISSRSDNFEKCWDQKDQTVKDDGIVKRNESLNVFKTASDRVINSDKSCADIISHKINNNDRSTKIQTNKKNQTSPKNLTSNKDDVNFTSEVESKLKVNIQSDTKTDNSVRKETGEKHFPVTRKYYNSKIYRRTKPLNSH